MNSQEFYLWLNGYLEALESEGIKTCKIESIREKMEQVMNNARPQHERVVFGPNIKQCNKLICGIQMFFTLTTFNYSSYFKIICFY